MWCPKCTENDDFIKIFAGIKKLKLFLFFILRRGESCGGFETGGEIMRITETASISDLLDGEIGLRQQRTSMFDTRGLQEILGREVE